MSERSLPQVEGCRRCGAPIVGWYVYAGGTEVGHGVQPLQPCPDPDRCADKVAGLGWEPIDAAVLGGGGS